MSVSNEEPTGKCFIWSFNPVLLWINLIGVDLQNFPVRSKTLRRSLFACYNLFLFLATIGSYLASWMLFHQLKLGSYFQTSKTFSWNTTIDFSNFVIHSVGLQLGLWISGPKKWTEMRKLLREVELEFQFDDGTYDRFRKMSIAAALCIFFLVSVHFVSSTNHLFSKTNYIA